MADAGAIRAGRAFVEFGADDGPLRRALTSMQGRLVSFASKYKLTRLVFGTPEHDAKSGQYLGQVGGLVNKLRAAGQEAGKALRVGFGVAIGGAITSTFSKVVGFLAEVPGRAAAMDVLSKKLGTTTQEVSALAYAFEQQGVSFDQFQGVMEGLATSLSAAADGADDGFRRIGLNARALIRLPLPESLEKVVDGLNRITLEEDRLRFANEHGLGALLPILSKGSAGLRELKAEAAQVGAVVNPADAARGREVMLQYTKTWQALKYAVLEAGTALLPSKETITRIGELVRGLIASLRRLGEAFREWAAGVYEQMTGVGGSFHEVAQTFSETWGGIVAAVKKGDLAAAFQVLAAGVKAVWYEMLIAMGKAFGDWVEEHQTQLIVLGSLIGGRKGAGLGARLGARFGPNGAIVGGVAGLLIGGAGGGVGGYQLASGITGLGHSPELEGKAKRARADLAAAVARATGRTAAGEGGGGGEGAGGESLMEFIARAYRERGISLSVPGGQGAKQAVSDALGNAVKGTFALPAAQQQLGYGDNSGRKIIDGVGKIADNAAQLPLIRQAIVDLQKRVGFK